MSEPMGHRKDSPKGKCIAMSAYIKNTEELKNDLMLHVKLLEKQEQN
jgi:hypothetical protein